MNARLARKIELNVDRVASAILAAAVAYAGFRFFGDNSRSLGIGVVGLGAVSAYFLTHRLLRFISKSEHGFRFAEFEVAYTASADELILTDADRLWDELILTEANRLGDELVLTDADKLAQPQHEPLILDDVVEAIGPDSRVVRLFDRRSMPTPGDLQSRIENHIDRSSSGQGPDDASQELADALAELRKALR